MNDITAIYLTANEIPDKFRESMQATLIRSLGDIPVICVSKERTTFPRSNVSYLEFDTPRSHVNIYREALAGVKLAETKYIAIVEDDVLYPKEHFIKRPTQDDVFAYNIACWSIYTWSNPPIFSYTGRRNHGMLICTKDIYIEAFEERFAKYQDDTLVDNANWAEPGKYEDHLGVTKRKSEIFYTDPSCVMFTHPKGLSYHTLGERKRLAPIRALEIPHWGRAEAIVTMYE